MKKCIFTAAAALFLLSGAAFAEPNAAAVLPEGAIVLTPAEAIDAGIVFWDSASIRTISLPPPSTSGGMPLRDALSARATHREFSSEALSEQELSDLLWAANGFNRPDARKRTAPTAINRQEIDIYVFLGDGAYFWDSEANELRRVCGNDLRCFVGRMNAGADNFAVKAPVTLAYVVDYERQGMQERPADAFKYASVDCGFVGQNVYLHCAASGLNTVFLGMIDAERISKALALPATKVPMFAQTVGKSAGE